MKIHVPTTVITISNVRMIGGVNVSFMCADSLCAWSLDRQISFLSHIYSYMLIEISRLIPPPTIYFQWQGC